MMNESVTFQPDGAYHHPNQKLPNTELVGCFNRQLGRNVGAERGR